MRGGSKGRRTFIVLPVALAAGALLVGCAAGSRARPTIEPPPPPLPTSSPPAESSPEADALRESLGSVRDALASAWEAVAAERLRAIRLERQSLELRVELAAVEAELAVAIDEVLRSKANLSGGQGRALAASRISEVRVAAQAVRGSREPEGLIGRAEELLGRADAELDAANYPGAAYLAERASELVRRARLDGERGGSLPPPPELVVPLVPTESMIAIQSANLREGPGVEYERVLVIEVGQALRAMAQAGEWIQVEDADGLRGWVHQRLVAPAGDLGGAPPGRSR